MRRRLILALAAFAGATEAHAQAPTRQPLGVLPVSPGKQVDRVETTRVDFAPGQAMPAHRHAVPVVCFVAQGSFRTRIGDQPERLAPTGTTTYEPPGVTIHYFKNASATEPARLLCASLAGAEDKGLNVMLPPEPIP